jgi:hypothetical protein
VDRGDELVGEDRPGASRWLDDQRIRLLSELERCLAARGCSIVIADVWRDAEEFYRARGHTLRL